MSAPNSVYVIEGGGRMKIGSTANPMRRLASLQTASFTKLRLVRDHQCSDARLAEAMAHHLLREKRLQGEWFDVSETEASAAILRAIEMIEAGDLSLCDEPGFRASLVGRPPLNLKATMVRLPEGLAERIDAIAGKNRRAEFIREAVERAVENATRRMKAKREPPQEESERRSTLPRATGTGGNDR